MLNTVSFNAFKILYLQNQPFLLQFDDVTIKLKSIETKSKRWVVARDLSVEEKQGSISEWYSTSETYIWQVRYTANVLYNNK